MKLVDANVLIYAVDERSHHHEPSRRWLDEALTGHEPVGFAWVVLLAFLRLVTSSRVFPQPLTVDDAILVARRWLEQRAAVIAEPTNGHLDLLGELLRSVGTGGNLVADAHLAALAIRLDADVITFDRDFGRFPRVRWSTP